MTGRASSQPPTGFQRSSRDPETIRGPRDVPPYNFGDNWLFAASDDEQRHLQDSTIGVLGEIHAIGSVEERFAFLEFPSAGDTPLRRHVAHTYEWYEFATVGVGRSRLIERVFAWLEEHWPVHEGPPVRSWGDARIGNVMYRGFEQVGVFDWEMAGLGPRELDVSWLLYAHCFFQEMATAIGSTGMPGFLCREDVASTYESLTGRTLQDLDFYALYSAVQWGIVTMRTRARMAHFGERALPDDPDELLINRNGLERMLAGEYWR